MISQLCPQPAWCKSPGTFMMQEKSVEVEQKLFLNVGTCSWWWNIVSQKNTLFWGGRGNLIKYRRTRPREICQIFSDLSQSFPSFFFTLWPNYYMSLIYTSPTDFCTTTKCLCLLDNVNLTLYSTHFISFKQQNRTLGWHLNYLTDLQVSTMM